MNPGKVLCIIQARMGSTRLPGKVLVDIAGKSMLSRVVERLRMSVTIGQFVVATTVTRADDAVVKECRRLGVHFFQGSEEDVLDRFYQAARQFRADVIVRITADCPLIDPEVTDLVVRKFLMGGVDYASNSLERTYPRGLETEVMTIKALGRAWNEAKEPHERSHVTPYIYHHPETFQLLSVRISEDLSAFRWTVDTRADLQLVQEIYGRRGQKSGCFSWREALEAVKNDPALTALNRDVRQKALHEG